VALYDPIGPAQERAEMIWQFRDLCDLHHARPVFYQVRAENLPFYMDIGLTAIKLGEEARVDLRRFDLEAKGKEMKDLRYTWNRGTRDGLSLEIHEPGQAPMDELKEISDAWLTGKNVREKGFSLGRFSPTTCSISASR
jgi:phosphatidylglycerol lysyltransferase